MKHISDSITNSNTILNSKNINKIQQKDALVIQHNNLIESQYYLTLQEKRLMSWLISQIKPTDEDFKEHILSIKEFAALVEVKGDHLYKTLDDITTKLMKRIINLKDINNKSFKKTSLLCGVEYISNKGLIKLNFHPYLKPYMLQLKEQFTQIKLTDILGLKSIYSVRIYELLKQYQSFMKRTMILLDLRKLCGILEDQYRYYNDFKVNILERAKREINLKTDIEIDYTELKESRKIVAIEWSINPNKNRDLSENKHTLKAPIPQHDLIQEMLSYGISKTAAKQFSISYKSEDIRNALDAVELQIKRDHVKNPKAMLQVAIKERWHPEIFKVKKKYLRFK